MKSQKGAASFLIILIFLGVISGVLIGNPYGIRNLIFLKSIFKAEVQTLNPGVEFIDGNNNVITQTSSPNVKLKLTSPWSSSNSLGFLFRKNVLSAQTATFQVKNGSDDVNEENGNLSFADPTVWTGNGGSSTSSYAGFRFTNVSIPKGAKITSAKLSLHSYKDQWIRMKFNIAADTSFNSETFASLSKPSQRKLTTSYVSHDSNVKWNANTWYELNDISKVIQEVVNNSSWQSGNSLSLVLKGTGSSWGRKFVSSIESNDLNAPKLVISYTEDNLSSSPSPSPTTTSAIISENSSFTGDVVTISNFSSNPLITSYTFKDTTAGTKNIYVKFKSSTGVEKIYSSLIELNSLSSNTNTEEISSAFGKWSPNTKYDTCTSTEHDSYFVTGPDGKKYPTWHPSVHKRADGTTCTFGHEHGRDPRNSNLYSFIKSHFAYNGDTASSGLPFGLVNEAYGMRHEDHVGHKIEWENGIILKVNKCGTSAGEGCFDMVSTNITCDFLMKVHQGTHSKDAFTNNLHELEYFVQCSDGTKIASSKMVAFGKPGEITEACNKTKTYQTGTATPADSPSGGGVRFLPTKYCADTYFLVPEGKFTDTGLGLYEDWVSSNYLKKPDGSVLSYFDPHFAVFLPSRYFDPTKPDNLARSIDLCYMTESNGDKAKNGECDAATNYGQIKDITWDDPRSPFNGLKREMYFNQTWIKNSGGPTTWYTDPFGNKASTTAFPGSVKQFISATDNYNKTIFESQAIGKDRYYGGNGVHAPN